MKDKRLSITWKLIMYILGFLGAGVALIYLFHVYFKDSFYEYIKKNEIENAAKFIEEQVDETGINSSSTEMAISSLANENSMCVSIYDADNNLIFSRDVNPFCAIHKFSEKDIEDLRRDTAAQKGTLLYNVNVDSYIFRDMVFKNIFSDDNNGQSDISPNKSADNMTDEQLPNNHEKFGPHRNDVETMVYSTFFEYENQQYMIVLNSSSRPMGATADILGVEAIYVCIILVMFSAVLALVMFRKISLPLTRTNQKALQLARGNYDVRFDMVGYKEFDQLNETLNYAAEELAKTEELRRELLANISHDLRTPLTMIRGCGELMRDIPGECNEENIQIIINESQRLSQLVTDIMDYSKLQSGVMQLQLSRFSLTDMIEDIVTAYKKTIGGEEGEIEFEFDENAEIEGDYIKMTQVMHNLINNAINYSDKQKHIIVRQSVKEGMVRIDVIDEGRGIDKKDIPLIWERYYKVDKNRKRESTGTGLGLAIVKNIFELHKIEYGIESEKGKGSDFYFIIKKAD